MNEPSGNLILNSYREIPTTCPQVKVTGVPSMGFDGLMFKEVQTGAGVELGVGVGLAGGYKQILSYASPQLEVKAFELFGVTCIRAIGEEAETFTR